MSRKLSPEQERAILDDAERRNRETVEGALRAQARAAIEDRDWYAHFLFGPEARRDIEEEAERKRLARKGNGP